MSWTWSRLGAPGRLASHLCAPCRQGPALSFYEMSLWTPKDASRPLWTPGRKPPNYTGRRLLPHSFEVEYLKNAKGGERGHHQRVSQDLGGSLPPHGGCDRRAGMGQGPRGFGQGSRIVLQSGSPQGVDGSASAGAGHDITWWRQATDQQPPPSRAAPAAPAVDYLWGPPHFNGVEHLVNGPTFPLISLDLDHVALTKSVHGDWFHHPDPIADYSPGEDLEAGELFPYLQLHPPHCGSCMCQ